MNCIIDEDISKYINELQESKEPEIGLIIGSTKDKSCPIIFKFIRTPKNENERLPPITINKTKINLNKDLIQDHATLLDMMLPGGLSIIGLYICASKLDLNSIINELLDIIHQFKDVICPCDHNLIYMQNYENDSERILKLIEDKEKPKDIKFNYKKLSLKSKANYKYTFSFSLPVTESIKNFEDITNKIIQSEEQKIKACLILINNEIIKDEIASEIINKEELDIKFITPIENEFKIENEGGNLNGHMKINSTISSNLFILELNINKLNLNEIIKTDLIKSIKSRLNILILNYRDNENYTTLENIDYFHFPKQIWFNWDDDNNEILLRDYVMYKDSLDDIIRNANELINLNNLSIDKIIDNEEIKIERKGNWNPFKENKRGFELFGLNLDFKLIEKILAYIEKNVMYFAIFSILIGLLAIFVNYYLSLY